MAKKNLIITLKTETKIGDVTAGRTTPAPTFSIKPKTEDKTEDKSKESE